MGIGLISPTTAERCSCWKRQFTLRSGEFIGAFRHIGEDDRAQLRIELIGDEALKTSETATRDLQNLIAIGALERTGELRHTRYHLKPTGP